MGAHLLLGEGRVLDPRNHQGQFGEGYVRALGSAAGLVACNYSLDVDGVDLGLRLPGQVGTKVSPAIDVQVKSWSRPQSTGGELRFDGLNEVQFNWLAGPGFTVPRFLFVICVPRDPQEYATFRTDGMTLRQLGYYCSLECEDRIVNPNNKRRRPVRVQLSNVLTVRSLLSLFDSAPIGSGGAV